MEKMKLNRNHKLCIVSVIIIVFAQALEKILEVAITPSQTVGIVSAMFYTLLVALVYFTVSKGESSFWGMFAAILALKMLPPNITYLIQFSLDGAMLYFIVQKAALILFAVLVYKFYCEQEKPRQINALPIIMLIVAVPFFNEIDTFSSGYLYAKTGSMLLPYFAKYACYIAASLVILVTAYRSSRESMRLTAYFEFCAFGINAFRQIGKIGYFAITHQHISKSIYGWIIVFAALMVINAFMLTKKNKTTE